MLSVRGCLGTYSDVAIDKIGSLKQGHHVGGNWKEKDEEAMAGEVSFYAGIRRHGASVR